MRLSIHNYSAFLIVQLLCELDTFQKRNSHEKSIPGTRLHRITDEFALDSGCGTGRSNEQNRGREKILEKWIAAQGGRDLLSKIRDTKATSAIDIIPMNLSGIIITYQKEPNRKEPSKIRIDTKIMGITITQAFNGKRGWMTNPLTGSTEEMPEPSLQEFKKQAMGNDMMLNPEKYGVTTTFEGQKSLEGKDYIVLKQTYNMGSDTTLYIDPKTYLVYKSVAMATDSQTGGKVESETIMSDYRDVQGTKVPFSVMINRGGNQYATVTFTEYKYNSILEDSLFDSP